MSMNNDITNLEKNKLDKYLIIIEYAFKLDGHFGDGP